MGNEPHSKAPITFFYLKKSSLLHCNHQDEKSNHTPVAACSTAACPERAKARQDTHREGDGNHWREPCRPGGRHHPGRLLAELRHHQARCQRPVPGKGLCRQPQRDREAARLLHGIGHIQLEKRHNSRPHPQRGGDHAILALAHRDARCNDGQECRRVDVERGEARV